MKTYIFSILFLALVSCGGERPQQQFPPPNLPVIKVKKQNVEGYKLITANIEGVVNDEVRPKVAGYITEVLVDEGQQVRKGQILFKLETRSASQQALAAKANVESQKIEVEKLKPLVEEGIVSSKELETARTLLANAEATYNGVLAEIDYANVRTLVGGVVGEISSRKGNLVSPNDMEPITTVSNISEVYAYYSMNEKDYLTFLRETHGKTIQEKVKNFPKVKLVLADDSEYEHEGTVETTTGQINPETGTVSFRAKFPNPEGLLTNGNSGFIKIPQYYENVTIIPEQSSFEDQTIVYVYKVDLNDTVRQAAVKTIARVDNLILVSSGVNEGESIVGRGVAKIRDGAYIKPIPVAFDSIAQSTKTVFKTN